MDSLLQDLRLSVRVMARSRAFTTVAVLLMQAYAFDLYLRIALFVQIIVTNCMILGRAEVFASRRGVLSALVDALGTAAGFALALIVLGSVRELLATGALFANMELLRVI